MEKWFCWGAIGTSAFLFLLFVLDLVTKSIPFGGLSALVDILGSIGWRWWLTLVGTP